MSTKHCPKCNAIVEFAQCDYRICDECGWRGSWTRLIDNPPIVTPISKLKHELRVVCITNNLENYPEHVDNTDEFPHLVSRVEDECKMFIVDTVDVSNFWPADEFFHIVNVTEFLVDGDQLE